MKTLQSLIYLSKGNLPSKMAHSIQIAKMAQAMSQKLENFELVTCGDIGSTFKGMDAEFQSWYGLHRRFKLVRLPMHIKVNYPFPLDYGSQNFYKLAVLYACLKSPSLLYTRTPAIVANALKIGAPIVWEWHEPTDEKNASVCNDFFSNKNLIGVITTLPQLAENYFKHGLPLEKVLIAPNAVDLQNFLPYQGKLLARQKLSLSEDSKIIVYSGHLYEYKGIPTILEIARLMPQCLFVLVGGWAEDVERVKEDCSKKNLQNVFVKGHVLQSQLADYLYAADVLILPTSKYWSLANATCPLKLFDYMVVRRPIVASALPSIMTVIRDRYNALLAEPDDPLSFKEAIEKILENSMLANTIAERAYHDVQNYTWDKRAEKVLQFLEERLQKVNGHVSSPRGSLVNYAKQRITKYL